MVPGGCDRRRSLRDPMASTGHRFDDPQGPPAKERTRITGDFHSWESFYPAASGRAIPPQLSGIHGAAGAHGGTVAGVQLQRLWRCAGIRNRPLFRPGNSATELHAYVEELSGREL